MQVMVGGIVEPVDDAPFVFRTEAAVDLGVRTAVTAGRLTLHETHRYPSQQCRSW